MRPPPDPDDPIGGYFWKQAALGQLTAQRCGSCGHTQHPAALLCAQCRSASLAVVSLPPEGHLAAYVIPRRPIGVVDADTIVAVVEVEPGIRMVSNLVGAAATEIHVGMRLVADFGQRIGDVTIPTFRPATPN